MDIRKALKEIDDLYRTDRSKVEERLLQLIGEAGAERDMESQVTLLNEGIGFYRDRGRYAECRKCCESARAVLDSLGMGGTVPYATTLLNIATAYRAEGALKEARAIYEEVREIYDRRLDPSDYLYAALYNNISLLCEQERDYQKSAEYLRRALDIVSAFPEARIENAVSHVNLARVLLKTGNLEEAESEIRAAMDIFLQDEVKDFHYSMALSVLGEILYRKGEYAQAEAVVLLAMDELKSRVGRTDSYEQLEKNLEEIRRAAGKSCRASEVPGPVSGSTLKPDSSEWDRKVALAMELSAAGQAGQVLYEKTLNQGDRLTAVMLLLDFVKHSMRAAYLLNQKEVPGDELLRQGLKDLPKLGDLEPVLCRIISLVEAPPHGVGIGRNPFLGAIETAAGLLTAELAEQGLTKSRDIFLPLQAVLLIRDRFGTQT